MEEDKFSRLVPPGVPDGNRAAHSSKLTEKISLTGEHVKSTQKSRRRRVPTFKISSRRDGLKSILNK